MSQELIFLLELTDLVFFSQFVCSKRQKKYTTQNTTLRIFLPCLCCYACSCRWFWFLCRIIPSCTELIGNVNAHCIRLLCTISCHSCVIHYIRQSFPFIFSFSSSQSDTNRDREKIFPAKVTVVVVLIQVSNVSKSIQKHWEGRTCGSKSVFTASHQVLRFSTKKGGRLMYTYYTYSLFSSFLLLIFSLSLSLVSRALLSIFLFL